MSEAKIFDKQLLAKVSSGDLVASEAKYHAKCLVALYNAAARAKTSEQNDNCEGGIYSRDILCTKICGACCIHRGRSC